MKNIINKESHLYGKKPSHTIGEKRKGIRYEMSGRMTYKYVTLKFVIVVIRITDDTSPNGCVQRHYE